jgi:hypothetical protein
MGIISAKIATVTGNSRSDMAVRLWRAHEAVHVQVT